MKKQHEQWMSSTTDRERHRRRVESSTLTTLKHQDEQKTHELLSSQLTKQSTEERRIIEEIWKTQQYHSILRENSAYRTTQESLLREERIRTIEKKNESIYTSMKSEHTKQVGQEMERLTRIREDEKRKQHEENISYVASLTQRLVNLSYKTACYREVSEEKLIPHVVWKQWMKLWGKGIDVVGGEDENNGGQEEEKTFDIKQGDEDLDDDDDEDVIRRKQQQSSSNQQQPDPSDFLSTVTTSLFSSLNASKPTSSPSPFSSQQQTVNSLIHTVRSDTNEKSALLLDETTLDDYLTVRNEWSYDLKEVAPEYVTAVQAHALAHVSSQSELKSPLASPTGGSSRKSMEGSLKKAMKESVSVASTTNAGETASELGPALPTFLPPLHVADTLDLTPAAAVSSSSTSSSSPPDSNNQNPLFSALLQRITDVASGKEVPLDLPELPTFPLSILLLGKPYSGKSTQAKCLEEKFGLVGIRVQELIQGGVEELERIEANGGSTSTRKNGNAENGINGAIPTTPSSATATTTSSTASRPISRSTPASSSSKKSQKTPYHLALIKMKKLLLKNDPLPDEILVALVVEKIRRLPGEVKEKKEKREKEMNGGGREEKSEENGEVVTEAAANGDASSASYPSLPLIPGEGGYVLIDFPTTLAQAKLLEFTLSGFVPPVDNTNTGVSVSGGASKPSSGGATKSGVSPSTTSPTVPSTTLTSKKSSKTGSSTISSKLVRPLTPPPHTGPYPSAFDLVLRFDVANEILLKRARGERIDPVTGTYYHLDYLQPTEQDMEASVVVSINTGGVQSKSEPSDLKARLVLPAGSSTLHATLPERFLTYESHESELESWFSLFGNMEIISGTHDVTTEENDDGQEELKMMEEVREEIRTVVRERIQQIDARKQKEEAERQVLAEQQALANGDVAVIPQHPLEKQALEIAAAGQNSGSGHAAGGEDVQVTISSVGRQKQSSESDSTPSNNGGFTYPIFTPSELHSFSTSGFYDKPLSSYLLQKWSTCENNYLVYTKQIFRQIRQLRNVILEYFAQTRRNFYEFLKRPDGKQVLLDAFQHAFNSIPYDLRSDQQTKEELHMRLDELAEGLWRVNTQKHEENEQEFAKISGSSSGGGMIMNQGNASNPAGIISTPPTNDFLESHYSNIFYYYSLLIQLEYDRYYQTIKIAQDFFSSMKGGVIYEEKSGGSGVDGSKKGAALNLPLTMKKSNVGLASTSNKKNSSSSSSTTAASNSASTSSIPATPNAGMSANSTSSSSKKLAKGINASSTSSSSSALSTARKRLHIGGGSDSTQQQAMDDPFTELLEIVRANFISPEEALEQVQSAQEMDVAQGSSTVTTAGKKVIGGKTSNASNLPSQKTKQQQQQPQAPNTSSPAASAQQGGRTASAKKRVSAVGTRGSVSGAGTVVSSSPSSSSASSPTSKPTRDALLDAQLRAFITHENRLLSSRIRRIHRNALLEMYSIRVYNEMNFLTRLDRFLEMRIRGESAAIDSLLYHIQVNHIEGEAVIQSHLKLEGENCFIDEDVATAANQAEETKRKSRINGQQTSKFAITDSMKNLREKN